MQLNSYLSKYPELRALYTSVEQDYIERSLIHHNWQHNLRNLARGILIGELERANIKIVLAAILVHDIGRLHHEAGQDHHAAGAAIAPSFLIKSGFTEPEIEEICHCIRAHGPRGIEEPITLSAKVCYDVDVLSCSVGFTGVARVFDYFMREEGMSVKQMVEIPSGRRGIRQDFYTKTGRNMGAHGFKKAANFWQDLQQEFYKEESIVREIIPGYEVD
jgi:HD superfamily phosphodiesterase